MTLKEKFKEILTAFWINDWEDECEKIADEYAIEFLEFIEGTYSFGNIIGKWYLHSDTSKEYTTKELLEIYKKEKGL